MRDLLNILPLEKYSSHLRERNVMRYAKQVILCWLLVIVIFTNLNGAVYTSNPTGGAPYNWNNSANWTSVPFTGSFPQLGDDVIIQGGHIITVNTPSQCANLSVNGTLTFDATIARTLTVNGNLSGGGTVDMSGGSKPHILNLGGINNSIGTLTPSTASTINYNGNVNQLIFASQNYRNLSTSTSGTKTLAGDITVNGNLTIGALTALDVSNSNFTITIKGNWIHNGTFNQNNGTVIFTGANNQSITVINPGETFYNLTINKSSGYVNPVTGNTLTISNNLLVTSGTLDLGTTTTICNIGTADIDGTLSFSGTATKTVTISDDLSGLGTIDMSGGNLLHTLNLLGANNSIGTLTTAPVASTVNYKRSGNQEIFASLDYCNLIISGGGVKTLQGNNAVANNLILNNGLIDINTYNLTINSSGQILNYDASKYIIAENSGSLIQYVAGIDKVFPVGTSTSYTPIILNNSGGIADNYSVNVFPKVTDNGLSSGTDVGFLEDCVKMTWQIDEENAGGSNLTITPQWNSADEGSSFNRNDCNVSYYDGTSWMANASAPAGGSNPYEKSLTGTDVGSFAVSKKCTGFEDNVTPVAICKDIVIQLNASGDASISPAMINNNSTVNCGSPILSLNNKDFTCADIGPQTVILTVKDTQGKQATCTATVTVEDTIKPVAACKNTTIQLDATGNASIDTSMIDDGSFDNCTLPADLTFTLDKTNFDCSNIGVNNIILTVTDKHVNSKTCIATVTVKDTIKPIAVCKNITVQLDATGNASIDTSMINNGSSDNCTLPANLTFTLDKTSFDCSNIGTNNVTLTVSDEHTNSNTCNATVTVEDNVIPNALCKPVTVQLDALGSATITPSMINNNSSDNCTLPANLTFALDKTSFDCSNIGPNIVTLTVTDEHTNSNTCTATVTVEDNVIPNALCRPVTVQLDAMGSATITPAMIDNSSSDNCTLPANLTFALDKTSFDCSNIGPNIVTLTVTDEHTNSNTCTATVIVEDNVIPTALCKPVTVQLDALGSATITPAMIDNGSSDNCTLPANLNFSLDKYTFDCSNVGPNNVTLKVTDQHANTNTCTATVTVQYPVAPSVSVTPTTDTICNGTTTNITFSNTIPTTWTWTVSAPGISGASDNLTGTQISIQQTLTNNSNSPKLVTYTITPAYYNSCSQTPVIATVWVEPTINIIAASDTLCSNSTTNIKPLSTRTTTNGIRYTWTVSSNPNITGATGSAGNDNSLGTAIGQTLINNSVDKQLITYTITPHAIDAAGNNVCSFNSIDVDIWVEPTITITASNNNICNNSYTNIATASANNTTLGIRYTWTATDPSGKVSGYSNSTGYGQPITKAIIQKLFNSDNIVHTVTYNITPFGIKADSSLHCNGIPLVITVLVNPTLQIVLDSLKDSQCAGGNTGKIYITTKGGVMPYQFSWSCPDNPRYTEDILNLYSGNYYITVTDNLNCTKDTFFTINQPPDISWNPNKSSFGIYPGPVPEFNIRCKGQANGYYKPFIPGATIVSYQWSGPNGYSANTKDIINLKAGPYTLVVKDNKGCYTTFTDVLTEPDSLKYNSTVKVYPNNFNVQCDGDHNGDIQITNVTGGYGKYHYNWTTVDGSGIIPASPTQSTLGAGTYLLTINDDTLCSASKNIVLTQPVPLVVKDTIPVFNGYGVACHSGQTGTIDLTVSGGFGGYSYNWSTANGTGLTTGTEDQHTLSAGTYLVTVTYGGLCAKNYSYSLQEPTAIQVDSAFSLYGAANTSCHGSNDGTIAITPQGGIPGYTYRWTTSDGRGLTPLQQNQNNLTGGHYTLEVTDKNLCKLTHTFRLTQPDSVRINFTSTPTSCSGASDGSLMANITGGTPSYTYQWANGSTSQTILGLAVGAYAITVTDQHLCKTIDAGIVNPPIPLTVTPSITSNHNGQNVSCYGSTDASVALRVTGGKSPYKYQWSTGDTTQILTNIGANTYTVLVFDKNNCQGTSQITVTQPDKIGIAYTKQDVLCNGFTTGNISLTVTGGTTPYSYTWSGSQTTRTIDKINAGQYTVTVADINNCQLSQSIEVSQPSLITGNPSIVQPYCNDDDQGSITLQIEGGIAPYQIIWNTNDKTSSLDHIRPGIYIYKITDMNNCVIRDTINLLPIHPACLDVPSAFSPNGDGKNDTWIILAGDPKNPVEVSTMYPRAIIEVYSRWGTVVYRSEPGYPSPWDGSFHGRSLPLDSYYYIIDTKCGSHPVKGVITIVK